MSIIRLGSPSVPIKITIHGSCLSKLEYVWQAARKFAKRYGYKVNETYGVVDVAPF